MIEEGNSLRHRALSLALISNCDEKLQMGIDGYIEIEFTSQLC